MKRLILAFFVSIFIGSCSGDRPPEGVIESGKMISLLTDIHLINSYLNSSGRYDSTTQPINNYYKVVYKKYRTDSVQFQKSLRYYSAEPQVLDTMYYQVLQRLNQLERTESLNAQREAAAQERLRVQKENAKIILKPQPDAFFRTDTFDLFSRAKTNRPVPPAL